MLNDSGFLAEKGRNFFPWNGGRIYAIERKKTGSRRFAGRTEEQFDDLTMLCLEYKGNAEQTQDLPISEIAEE